jgi:hypothetical protein
MRIKVLDDMIEPYTEQAVCSACHQVLFDLQTSRSRPDYPGPPALCDACGRDLARDVGSRPGDPTVRHVVAWMRATYPQNAHAQECAGEIERVFLNHAPSCHRTLGCSRERDHGGACAPRAETAPPDESLYDEVLEEANELAVLLARGRNYPGAEAYSGDYHSGWETCARNVELALRRVLARHEPAQEKGADR